MREQNIFEQLFLNRNNFLILLQIYFWLPKKNVETHDFLEKTWFQRWVSEKAQSGLHSSKTKALNINILAILIRKTAKNMLSIKHTRKKDVRILRTDVTAIFENTHAPQVLCKAIRTKPHWKITLMHLVQMLPSVIYVCKLTYKICTFKDVRKEDCVIIW